MNITRIHDLLPYLLKNFPKDDTLAAKESGTWKKFSTKDFSENSEAIALAFLNRHLKPGDTVATISNNRPEWNFLDFGMLQSGIIHVPIYPTISKTDLNFILKDAKVKMVFAGTKELALKVKQQASENLPVFTIEPSEEFPSLKDFIAEGKNNLNNHPQLQEIKSQIQPNDLATILYTSGTTGEPKGVMLSHNNIISNFIAVKDLPPVDHTCRALSFLPLNHVYERMLVYLYLFKGVSIYYAEGLETIAANLKEVKPHIFTTVPRLLEKVFDKIVAKGEELSGIKRKLFFWALNLGLQHHPDGNNKWWHNQQLSLARKIIFSKWREALGGNVRAIVSGGAALQPRLAKVFWAAGIPVLEGYGLTETSPVIAVNTLEKGGLKVGTVGKVIKGVKVKIAEDGEILCKGPNIMLGYYKHPEWTAEMIDTEGWLHTGDIGEIVDNKFLKITDRKKEIFKTTGGKYIAPQMIENKLKESPFIEQAMVIGSNKKFASALIVPSFGNLKEWGSKNNINFNSNEEIILNGEVQKLIRDHIHSVNNTLAPHEAIKKPQLLPKEWTIENGELTPKLSLKRREIEKNHKDVIEKIFGEEIPVESKS